MQIQTKHVAFIELLTENIPISISNRQHALGTRTDGWKTNSEKSELISSNITLGFPSLSILKLLKAEQLGEISEERKHLFPIKKAQTCYLFYLWPQLFIETANICIFLFFFFFPLKILEKRNGKSNYYLS